MAFKNEKVRRFVLDEKGELTGIRSVILFGRNVMSYKFALCDALLKLPAKDTYKYEDILPHFIDSFLPHVEKYPKQGQSERLGKFTEAAIGHAKGELTREELDKIAASVVHQNVFTAFQMVGGAELKDEFGLFEWDKSSKVMTLKDDLLSIMSEEKLKNLVIEENQSRWEIVEEAWKIGVSPGLVYYDEETEQLIKYENSLRINLRSAVDAFMPYQKGVCFYCPKPLNRFGHKDDGDYPEVDHVLALARLRDIGFTEGNINGLWNLVLACRDCNREKSAKIPEKRFIEKLATRNEYLIEEHGHTFKTGILMSLGLKSTDGKLLKPKMIKIYNQFQALGTWKPKK